MRKIVLLRGVTPTGRNRIPKMAYLAEILENAGFSQVKTFIQSGNIALNTELSDTDTCNLIHRVILQYIGADLSVIIKDVLQLAASVKENPFKENYDESRVHLVFTNDPIDNEKLNKLLQKDFADEKLWAGSECLYMYLPREAARKTLNTNYLERQLGITATMRKLSVISRLSDM